MKSGEEGGGGGRVGGRMGGRMGGRGGRGGRCGDYVCYNNRGLIFVCSLGGSCPGDLRN